MLDLEAAGLPVRARRAPTPRSPRSSRNASREKFAALRASAHPQAQFLWALPRPVPLLRVPPGRDRRQRARRRPRHPLGFRLVARARSRSGRPPAGNGSPTGSRRTSPPARRWRAPLPAWVFDGRTGVHAAAGIHRRRGTRWSPRSTNPVYARQRFPDPLLGESAAPGRTVFENDGVRMWVDDGDDIAVVGFKTKMHTVNDQVLAGLQERSAIAERDFRGLVIWQPREPFSAGADLAGALGLLQAGDVAGFEAMVAHFQATSQRIKYALVPVVRAVRGMALGGGCEFQMHAARTVRRSKATSASSKRASVCCPRAAA